MISVPYWTVRNRRTSVASDPLIGSGSDYAYSGDFHWRQTDRQTDGRRHRLKPSSYYVGRVLNNYDCTLPVTKLNGRQLIYYID